jgi:hypothetical protein
VNRPQKVFFDCTFSTVCIRKPTYHCIDEYLRLIRVGFMPVLFRGHIVGRANAGAGEIDFLIEHF